MKSVVHYLKKTTNVMKFVYKQYDILRQYVKQDILEQKIQGDVKFALSLHDYVTK